MQDHLRTDYIEAMPKAAKNRTVKVVKARSRRLSPGGMRILDASAQLGQKVGTLRFGSVEIKAALPGPAEFQQNIIQGREALSRATSSLTKPGVKLKRTKGVPLYAIDPDRPDLLVRNLDGKREHGVFEGGQFKVTG